MTKEQKMETKQVRNVAIITARGGSKRIPRKNIRPFCGRPIIAYSIDAALACGKFDLVMVSTDSEEIARISQDEGAVVPFLRSKETAGEMATTSDVLIEVLQKLEEEGQKFDQFCCIYPTAPFVTKEKLSLAMDMLEENPLADTILPVVRFSFPPQRGVYIQKGKVEKAFPQCYEMRSQDLEPMYHDCGQFYCARTTRFLASHKLIGEHVVPLVMSGLEVQDIDNEEDWEIAEMKFRLMQGKTQNQSSKKNR